MTKNIDITKPIRVLTDGRPARIVASGLTGPIKGLSHPYMGGETLLIDDGDGELWYAYPDGSITPGAEPIYGNALPRVSEFRNFNSRGRGGVHRRMTLGGTQHSSLTSARNVSFRGGEGVLEMIREGDKLVDVKFHAKA